MERFLDKACDPKLMHALNLAFIGDTVFDIDMGVNAGVRTCGVTYGNGSRESLAHADWIIDDFGQITDIHIARERVSS